MKSGDDKLLKDVDLNATHIHFADIAKIPGRHGRAAILNNNMFLCILEGSTSTIYRLCTLKPGIIRSGYTKVLVELFDATRATINRLLRTILFVSNSNMDVTNYIIPCKQPTFTACQM